MYVDRVIKINENNVQRKGLMHPYRNIIHLLTGK